MIEAIEERRESVSDLCRRFHVERLDIFGSAASGGFDEEASDLDFLLVFQRVESMSPADQFFGLLSELQGLFAKHLEDRWGLYSGTSVGGALQRAGHRAPRTGQR